MSVASDIGFGARKKKRPVTRFFHAPLSALTNPKILYMYAYANQCVHNGNGRQRHQ